MADLFHVSGRIPTRLYETLCVSKAQKRSRSKGKHVSLRPESFSIVVCSVPTQLRQAQRKSFVPALPVSSADSTLRDHVSFLASRQPKWTSSGSKWSRSVPSNKNFGEPTTPNSRAVHSAKARRVRRNSLLRCMPEWLPSATNLARTSPGSLHVLLCLPDCDTWSPCWRAYCVLLLSQRLQQGERSTGSQEGWAVRSVGSCVHCCLPPHVVAARRRQGPSSW